MQVRRLLYDCARNLWSTSVVDDWTVVHELQHVYICEPIKSFLADGGDSRRLDIFVVFEVFKQITNANNVCRILSRVCCSTSTDHIVHYLKLCDVSEIFYASSKNFYAYYNTSFADKPFCLEEVREVRRLVRVDECEIERLIRLKLWQRLSGRAYDDVDFRRDACVLEVRARDLESW